VGVALGAGSADEASAPAKEISASKAAPEPPVPSNSLGSAGNDDAEAQAKDSAAAAEAVKSGDIAVPREAAALAAFHALEKNCARCHQAGPTLKRAKPAKNFGNILHLDEIVRDPNFILPGNPDGSQLFIQIAKKEMPYDCYQEFDCKEEPTEAEVQAVYDWIKGLGDVTVAACAGRKTISEEAIVTAIAADLARQPENRRQGMRYVTLSNFYSACAPETDLVRYRQGVVKLLNSLSRSSHVLPMRTIDADETIIGFHLDNLNWTTDDWARIIGSYPYAMKPDTPVYDKVVALTGTKLAWVRGDWLAFIYRVATAALLRSA
jgi:hypothetical protein